MKPMRLSPCIYQFFDQYLPHIKGMSHNTIQSYRDAFKLLLPFAADHYGIKISSLRLNHISTELIIAFLQNLEQDRKNLPKTRNLRLNAIKTFIKMIRLMYPDHREMANRIIHIPQKRFRKPLIGFLYPEEMLKIFQSVDLGKKEGFRDYTLLHLLYDSGARASEITTLNLDYFNPQQKTLAIMGKGNRFRLIPLQNKTNQLLQIYIRKYRLSPKPLYQYRIFINQRGEELTRHGIYRICKKYLTMALTNKRLKVIHPAHSFRHTKVMDMLYEGKNLAHVRNQLGHDSMQSTMIYTHMDIKRKRQIQKRFIRYMDSTLSEDPKLNELLSWENEKDLMDWLDSL
jgi:site-specific recombinase XerD